jgi:hypothetical protein
LPQSVLLAIAALAAVAVAWLVLGILAGVRRGNRAAVWIRAGLAALGEGTEVRWAGPSTVEIGLRTTAAPFRRATVTLVLIPREATWRRLAARLTGRADLLEFRADLVAPPVYEFRVDAARAWTAHDAERDARRRRWAVEKLTGCVVCAPRADWERTRARAVALLALAAETHPEVGSLTIQAGSPHFEVRLPVPGGEPQDPEAYFRPFADWAAEAQSGGREQRRPGGSL